MKAKGFMLGRFDGAGKLHPIAILSVFSKTEELQFNGFFNEVGNTVLPLEEAVEILLKEVKENLRKEIKDTDEELLELTAELEVEELLDGLPCFGVVAYSCERT
jgi:hypothetical protein